MRLIVITHHHTVPNEADIVNELFAHGLQRLHVRKPSFSEEEYRTYIQAIDKEYRSRICINAHFGLFRELNLGGIHLNSFVRDAPGTEALIKDIPPEAISTSFHSWQEVVDNSFPYGYVFISPVFDSISKADYEAAIDLDGIKDVKVAQANGPQIVGLGGVGQQQLPVLHKYGFDGAAMLGAIWLSADPVGEFVKVQQLIRQF